MINLTIRPIRTFVGYEKNVIIVQTSDKEQIIETNNDREKILRFVNELIKNKTFISAFNYENLNLWQFYYSHVVSDIFYALDLYETLCDIKLKNPNNHFVINIPWDRYKELTTKICRDLFDSYEINYTHLPNKFKEMVKYVIKKTRLYSTLKFLKNSILKKMYKILSFHYGSKHRKNDILLVTQGFYWAKSKNRKYYDRILYPLVSFLQEKGYTFHGIEHPSNLEFYSFKKFLQKKTKDSLGLGWYSFQAYEEKNSTLNIQDHLKIEESIRNNIDSMDYERSLRTILIHVLCELHAGLSLTFISHLKSATKIINQISPSCILATYETGPIARAIILIAHQKGIRTFALQHGMIIDINHDYMHDVVGVLPDIKGFIIPQTTLVWGEYWQDILCNKGQYPSENVFVLGNLGVSRSLISYKNTPDKHVLFLYSGIIGVDVLSEILTNIKKIIHIPIIVKAHPSVSANILQPLKQQGIVIADNMCDIHELIQDSYICISEISTAALEMLAINVNGGFIFNPTSLEGWEYLKEFGDCYSESKDDLIQKINKYVVDDEFRNNIRVSAKNEISKYFKILEDSDMDKLYRKFS